VLLLLRLQPLLPLLLLLLLLLLLAFQVGKEWGCTSWLGMDMSVRFCVHACGGPTTLNAGCRRSCGDTTKERMEEGFDLYADLGLSNGSNGGADTPPRA